MDNTNDTIFSDIENPEVAAGYWLKHACSLIDAAICIAALVLLTRFLPESLIKKLTASVSPTIWVLITVVFYRLITTLTAGKTIGMILCRVKYLNGEMKELTLSQKLLTVFLILYNGISYYKA